MEKILVTGGAGFIGSHVCRALLERGYQVVAVDNLNDYYSPALKKQNLASLAHPHFTFFPLDILNRTALEKLFVTERLRRVIHLAARAGVRPSVAHPHLYADVNIRGTLNLLECARQYGVVRFVFGSSSSVYGLNTKIPFSEGDDVTQQASPYGVSKRSGELYAHSYHSLYGLSVACLRFFTVYGPGGRPDMAPYLFTSNISNNQPLEMFGDGNTQRDYTFVTDIVAGVVAALEHPSIKFEIINLGNAHPVSLKEFIQVTEQAVGKKARIVQKPIPAGDVLVTCADTAKAASLFGYHPAVPIDKGMQLFVDWFKKVTG